MSSSAAVELSRELLPFGDGGWLKSAGLLVEGWFESVDLEVLMPHSRSHTLSSRNESS